MSIMQAERGNHKAGTVNRRQAIGSVAAASAVAVVAGGLAAPAQASDARLQIFEGKYAFDGHKIVDGYFATPRGKMGMDILLVIPGEAGLDDSVRALVRRHALAGKAVIAPDLAKTAGGRLMSRDAMIADLVSHIPRMRKHVRGNGRLTVLSA